MTVEYDLVSDAARVGYQLGQGVWAYYLNDALESADPIGEISAFLIEENHYEPNYAVEVAREISAFVAAHPDWRLINDQSSDITVCDEGEYERLLAEKWDPNDASFPMYRCVGSRYHI